MKREAKNIIPDAPSRFTSLTPLTSPVLPDPHGSFLPALLLHDLADRAGGRSGRANARWGLLRPPQAGGKLLWIVAGAQRSSVRLAVELARAIRDKRLDLRLVLTFEHEYADLLAGLAGLNKTGWGFGPCDRAGALRRTLERLNPLGVICAGNSPRLNLAAALAGVPHSLLVAAACNGAGFERAYPSTEAQQRSCQGVACEPAVNLLTLVMPSQVDPTLAALMNGRGKRKLWWWHGDDGRRLQHFIAEFRAFVPADPLFITGAAAGSAGAGRALAISVWNREPVPDRALVAVDDSKWLPALAAACTAIHFDAPDADLLWQAMAGGAAVSTAPGVELPKASLAAALQELDRAAAVAGLWAAYRDDAFLPRQRGDRLRRLFWQERRLAQQVSAELLERVFGWD